MLMDASMYLSAAVAGGVGTWLGWRFRGMRHHTERRVIEEIYMRKTRLAESEREIAVRTLDQAKLEASTNLERFEAASATVTRLEGDLATTKKALAATRESLAQTETRLASVLGEQDAKHAEAQAAIEEGARSVEARKRMETELEETRNLLTAELEEAREGLAGRTREIGDLTQALAERGTEISALQVEQERRDASLRRAASENSAASDELERRAATILELEARIAELEPLTAEVERTHRAASVLEERLEKKIAKLEAAEARISELEPLTGELEKAQRFVGVLEERLEKKTLKLEAAEARTAELERLPGELEKAHRSAAAIQEKLEKKTAKLEAAETRIAEMERLSGDLEKAQRTAGVLEERLGKRGEKLGTAETRIAALRQDLETAKAELENRHAQVAALANSHKATQLKLDQARHSIEDLQGALSERGEKLKEFQALSRERTTEVKALEAELKRANGNPRTEKGARSGARSR
jgi:chromosome segregation ATPase